MHAGRAVQRHAKPALTRSAAVVAAAALAGLALLAGGATPATADSVTVNPTSGQIDQIAQFTVSGTDSAPTGGFVDVSLNGVQVGTAPFTSEDTPAPFSGQVPVPAPGQPGALACGANQVVITNPASPGAPTAPPSTPPPPPGITAAAPQHVTAPAAQATPTPTAQATPGGTASVVATATLTAQCPAITLTPATISQPSEPAPVLVTGINFIPASTTPAPAVSISVDGHPAGSATTDFDGVFSVTIRATSLGCGVHQVTASQAVPGAPALTASTGLTVSGCKQSLTINPAVLEPGELTHVTGTGFTPAQPVTLTWRLPGGGAPPGSPLTVTADSRGGISTYYIVLPESPLGPRQLVATQAGASLTANAIIDGGPMQPSGGGRLIYRGS